MRREKERREEKRREEKRREEKRKGEKKRERRETGDERQSKRGSWIFFSPSFLSQHTIGGVTYNSVKKTLMSPDCVLGDVVEEHGLESTG